jgi:ABC-2 type transport system permease protein
MTSSSSTAADFPRDAQQPASAPMVATRPLYWSIRRELWENRSIYIAPLAVASVALFAFFINAISLPQRRRGTLLLDLAHQRAVIQKPYDMAAIALLMTAFVIAVFYCLDALYGERRDRSILFWKSLPVSDRTAVLAKASIPLAVLPLLVFVIVVITQFLMLLWTNLMLLIHGMAPTTSAQLPLFQRSLFLLYGLITLALWHAPLYAWLLVISGWARRVTYLWALLPPLLLAGLEKVAFNTTYIGRFLRYRLIGSFTEAFMVRPRGAPPAMQPNITPLHFLGTPGLWLGLLFAALCLAAAARLRRMREPI